jgi:hypothetical protein
MSPAAFVVALLELYSGLGLLFALLFVFLGVNRIDPQARDASPGFRLLILPGAAAFWPLLLHRWACGPRQPPEERNPHRCAALRNNQAGAP